MHATQESIATDTDTFHTVPDFDYERDGVITTTLPAGADQCFELFCDVDQIPNWATLIRSSIAYDLDANGRPRSAAFTASHGRASAGFTIDYLYDADNRLVVWSSQSNAQFLIHGQAIFHPLSERASLMHYRIAIDWAPANVLLGPGGVGHPASLAVSEFRAFVSRTFPTS